MKKIALAMTGNATTFARNIGIEMNLTDRVPCALYKNVARTTEFGYGPNHGGPLSGQVGNGALLRPPLPAQERKTNWHPGDGPAAENT